MLIPPCSLFAQGTYIIKFADETSQVQALQSNKMFSSPFAGLERNQFLSFQTPASNQAFLELKKYARFQAENAQAAQRIISRLRAVYAIEYAGAARSYSLDEIKRSSVSRVATNDPLLDEQWYVSKVRAPQSWKYSFGQGVTVAFIDTGIDWEHPDLKNSLNANSAEDINKNGTFEAWSFTETRNGITGDIDGIDNDRNGYTDDVIGYNFVDQYVGNLSDDKLRDGFPFDDQGHGTSVAGVIGAERNNGIGITGIAPGVKLMTLKAFDVTGNAEDDDVAAAIVYAVLNGAKVVNMSFGDNVKAPIVEDAIRYAYSMNVTLVSSSGNGGGLGLHFPSDYPQVISVGSTNKDDRRSVFSSFNSQLSLMAPGEGITTTSVGGGYRRVNGTSFAAPCVAAAAALLLQERPWLTPAMIRSMLCTASDVVNSNAWSLQYGNGRLNVEQALKNLAVSSMEIGSPVLDEYITLAPKTRISYTAGLSHPLCTSWKLQLMPGDIVEQLRTIDSGDAKDFTLSPNLNLFQTIVDGLRDTAYSVLLTANLVNGRSISIGTRIRLANASPRMKTEVFTPWKDGKRIAVINIMTDMPTTSRVVVRSAARDTIAVMANNLRWGMHHSLVFDNIEAIATATECLVTVETQQGTNATSIIPLALRTEYAPQFGFQQLQQRTNRLFVTNSTKNYNNNPRAFIATDFASEARPMGEYAVNADTIVRTSFIPQTFFPRGVGDSNGNGIAEVWAQSGPKSVLFERGTTAFSNIIFADSLNGDFWAARMADLNGDGRDELIGYRTNRRNAARDATSDAMEIWTNANGAYSLLAVLENPSSPAIDKKINNFTAPGCAVGDFDGDGKRNIAFTDSDGDVCVYEWSGLSFEREAVIELTGFSSSAGTEFTTEADMTGDGIPEILVATPAIATYNTDGEYDAPLWLIRVLGFQQGTYTEIARDYLYGTRYGSPFRNAVAAGNVDGVIGDELLLGLFPSLYVMSVSQGRLSPLWYTDRVWTGGIVVMDVNGNGKNDIGFVRSSTLNTEFWEYASSRDSLQPPTGLRAEYVERNGKRRLSIRWQPVAGAKAYSVRMNNATKQGTMVAIRSTSTTLDFPFDQILEPISYPLAALWVHSLSDTNQSGKLSNSSDTIVVSLQPTSVPVFSETSRLASSVIVSTVEYSGKLSDAVLPPDAARIVNESNELLLDAVQSVVSMGENRLLIVWKRDIPDGRYILKLNGTLIRDEWNNPTGDSLWQVSLLSLNVKRRMSVSLGNTITPESIVMISSDEIAEEFLTPRFFTMKPSGTIASITPDASTQSKYLIRFSEPLESRGYEYVITADTTIRSKDGKQMSSLLGNSLRWTYPVSNINCVYVYPQPANITQSTTVTFACVRQGAKVEIFTIEGVKIGEQTSLNTTGGVEWEMRFPDGALLTNGVYTFRVVDVDGSISELQKLLVKY
ncbi:MAG: S8 family serine peptidase [Candidatus Kapabacteria bacterium]|nr:S8 family serine peptidase [Candidatus Kapabacteria bacterium]